MIDNLRRLAFGADKRIVKKAALLTLSFSLSLMPGFTQASVAASLSPVSDHNFSVAPGFNSSLHHSATATNAGLSGNHNATSSTNFNLSSTQVSLTAQNSHPVSVILGGNSRSIQPGQFITPAEFVAINQVLQSGHQSLLLSTGGNATGGFFNLSTNLGSSVSALLIPKGVTGTSSSNAPLTLDISGTLTNSGRLVLLSSQSTIEAGAISNSSGALISTIVPSSLAQTLHAQSSGELSLVAVQNITNAGSIIASGVLNLSTPSFVNSGLVQSTNSNINISSPSPSSIVINNSGGTFQANGDINVRNSAFTGPFDVTISGGNLLSNNVNVWSGGGTVNLNVDNLTGVLNVSASAAHVLTNTSSLQLGRMNLSGDPTFYNSGGSISIDSAISTTGQDLAILAKNDILSNSSGSITTGAASGNSGNILMIAGAKFTTSSTSGGSDTSGQGQGDTQNTFTVTGASSLGGQIDLSQLSSPLDTTSTTGTGGNVTLVAFAGFNSNSGKISTGAVQTYSAGGTGGNIVLLAGAHSGSGISTGSLTTTISGTATTDGGQILLATAVPSVGAGLSENNGTVSSGNVTASSVQASSISVGAMTTNSAPITLVSGGSVMLNGSIVTGGTDSASTLNRPGGNLTIIAGGNIGTGSTLTAINTSAAGSNASGGNITAVAGAGFGNSSFLVAPGTTQVNTAISVIGSSATGGNIDFSANGANSLTTLSTQANLTAANATAGNVQLIAFNGSLPSSNAGTVNVPSAVTIQTSGGSSGNLLNTNINGDVIILAGAQSGTSINAGNITSNGGYGYGGNITVATAQATASLPFSYSAAQSPNPTISGAFAAGAIQPASINLGNLTAGAGTLNTPNGLPLTIQVTAGNNLTIGAVENYNNLNSSLSISAGAVIKLTAGGTMTFAAGATVQAIPVQALSGINGGNITLQAQSFNFSQSSTVLVSANGIFNQATDTTSNDGGSISIIGTGTGANGLLQVGQGFFQLNAQGDVAGGNGGTISVSSNGGITVTPQDSSNNLYMTVASQSNNSSLLSGNGGTISLNANGNVLIQSCSGCTDAQGGLDASGAPSTLTSTGSAGFPGGSGGTISITSNSGTAFQVYGSTTVGANGSQGPLSANANLAASGSVDASGNGGTIIINNLGAGGIVVNNRVVSSNSVPGIQVLAGDAQTTGTPGSYQYYFAGQGGNITLSATANLAQVAVINQGTTPSPGILSANGGNSNANLPGGSGGSITIVTNSKNYFDIGGSSTTNGAASLLAAGSPNSSSVTYTAQSDIAVPAGYGNGGHVSVTNNGVGGIYVESSAGPTNINVAAQPAENCCVTGAIPGGAGGSITLNSPAGPVLSLTSLDASGGVGSSSGANADGGNGGSITIVSNSSLHAFAVGTNGGNNGPTNVTPGVGNGVLGTLTAFGYAGGSISIENLGTTGVRIGTGLTGFSSPAAISVDTFSPANNTSVGGGAGGNISLQAPAGTVSIYAALNANGMTGANNGGNGGSIYILSNSSSAFLVNQTLASSSPNGSTGALSANSTYGAAINGNGGNITIVNNGGSINVAAGGVNAIAQTSYNNPLQTAGSQPGTGGNITLLAPSANSTVLVNGALSANGGYGNSPYSPEITPQTVNTDVYPSGNGGTITIVCNSSQTFRVGNGSDAPTSANNGINGLLSANGYNGGSVSVSNLGTGGIRVGSASGAVALQASAVDQVSGGAGGQGGFLTLIAPSGRVGVYGSLDVSGGANGTTSGGGPYGIQGGNAGSVAITTGTSTAFVIDPVTQPSAGSLFNGISGTLTSNGGAAAGVTGNAGKISVVNLVGGITIAKANALTVNVPQSTNVAGNGGAISLQASNGSVQVIGGLSADGGDTSNSSYNPGYAGSILISAKSSGTNSFNIGGATSTKPDGTTLGISASGWNGGTISILNNGTGGITVGSGQLLVNATAANTNIAGPAGPGGSITLKAPSGPVLVSGGLQANGGLDSQTVSTTTTVAITGSGANNNGNSAQNIAVTSSAGFANYQYLLIQGTSAYSTTVGGTGSFSGSNVVIPLNSATGFVIGQQAQLQTTSGPQSFTILASQVPPNGNDITVNLGTYTVNSGANASTSAPSIEREQVIPAPGAPSNTALNINYIQNNYVSGATISTYYPGGNGGQITIICNTATGKPFIVGTPTANGVSGGLTARGADGGAISITNLGAGGTIISSPSNLNASPRTPNGTTTLSTTGSLFPPLGQSQTSSTGGNGGQYFLSSTGLGGFVYIGSTSGSSVNASSGAAYGSAALQLPGNAGAIVITSNSSSPFNVGAASANSNGSAGTLTASGADGGTVAIKNLSTGGISFNSTNISVAALAGAGGTIDLQAAKGTINNLSGGTLNANAVGNGFNGGSITINANVLNLNSQALTLSATADSDGTSAANGGTISIQQNSGVLKVGATNSLTLTVDGAPSLGQGGTISLNAPAGISVSGGLNTSIQSLPQTGTIQMVVSGNGQILSGLNNPISTGQLTLSTGAATAGASVVNITTNVASLSLNGSAGNFSIVNAGSANLNLGQISLSGTSSLVISASNGVSSSGVLSAPSGTVSISTLSGNVEVNGNVRATTISLSSGNSGGIAGTGILYATSTTVNAITLSAGSGGIQGLNTSTAGLSLSSTGGIGGSSNMSIFNTGSLRLSVSGVNMDEVAVANDLGSLTVNSSISNAGNVNLSTVGNTGYSIILGGTVGAGGGANGAVSGVVLNAAGNITQSAPANIITANAIALNSRNGDVGIPTLNSEQNISGNNAVPINISVTSNSQGNAGTLSVLVPNGTAYISNASASLSLRNVSSTGDFQLSTQGTFSVDQPVVSALGSVILSNQAATGTVSINANITANGGPIVIQNNNTTYSSPGTGTITIASNVSLTGNARNVIDLATPLLFGGAGVAILSGAFPTQLPSDGLPANFNQSGTGQLNFSNGIVATVGPVNVSTANKTSILMNCTGCTPSNQIINFGSNVNVSSVGLINTLSSLDLTNANVVSALNTSGVAGITSSLTTNSMGQATGGTVTFASSFPLVNLNTINVPAKVTVAFNNFSAASPVIINQVKGTNSVINGTVQFSNSRSNGYLFVNSNVTGQVLTVNSGGVLQAANNLTVGLGGSLTMNGSVSLTGTGNGNLNLFTGGSTAPVATILPTTPAAGTMAIAGSITVPTTSAGSVVLSSSGNISQSTTSSISAPSVFLSIGGQRVSYAASSITLQSLTANSLTLVAGTGATVAVSKSSPNVNVSSLDFNFGKSPLTFTDNSALNLEGSSVSSIAITAPSIATSGNVSCSTCTFNTALLTNYNVLKTIDPLGQINLQPSSSSGLLTISATSGSQTGSFIANAGITIAGGTSGLAVNGGSFLTSSGTLSLSAPTSSITLNNSSFTAGTSNNYAGGLMTPSNVQSAGTVSITASSKVSGTADVQVVGGDFVVTSTSTTKGSISLQGTFEADGGNIRWGALNTVSSAGSFFTANAVGTSPVNASGGQIDISAGLSAAPIAVSDGPAGSLPAVPVYIQANGNINPLGNSIVINNLNASSQTYGTGAVSATGAGLTNINLSDANNVTTLNLSGGNMAFAAATASSAIKMDGNVMTVNGYSPIAFESNDATEIEVAAATSNEPGALARVFVPGQREALLLTNNKTTAAKHAVQETESSRTNQDIASVSLKSGTMFMKTVNPLLLRSAIADLRISKGAILSTSLDEDGLRIISCNGIGMVKVLVGQSLISLSAGQELIISTQQLSEDKLMKADGIGRRALSSSPLKDGRFVSSCDVSIPSLIGQLDHLRNLRLPTNSFEKKMANEMWQSAAALTLLTSKRGMYTAHPAPSRQEQYRGESAFAPVSFIK